MVGAGQGELGPGPDAPGGAVARAAFGLAIAAFALALPRPEPPRPTCDAPAEVIAVDGHTASVRCGDPVGPEVRGPARMLFGLPIDPNRADARTLEALPGIGPARAGAIVAERSRRPFEDVADLERVPGIGPKTRRAIAPWVAPVGEAPPPQNR